jgi:hypothetical protein
MSANGGAEFFLSKVNPQINKRGYIVIDVSELKEDSLLKLSAGMVNSTTEMVRITNSSIKSFTQQVASTDTAEETPIVTEEPPEQVTVQEEAPPVTQPTENYAQTPEDAVKLVEGLDPGNFTAFYEPGSDILIADNSYYFYINYSAATRMGGDVFVQQDTGKILGVTWGTETDPNAPFPDFSIELN